ncbi:YdaU family protein [Bradyrhizobium sp. 482_C4_N1_1]|uniref:YdaU family protein n=1 Tax=unclassified Bradyrhizobium TaxID=2631580 RepID=UPI003F89D507
MPLDIGDFLQDTQHLSTVEIGAYLLMIMAYWARGGPLPNRDAYRRVSRMTTRQWSSSGDLLMSFFGDDLRHRRLDRDLAHVIGKSEVKSANAVEQHRKRREEAQGLQDVSTTDLRPKTVKERDIEGTREREAETAVAEDRLPARPLPSADKQAAIALGLAFLNAAGFTDYADAPPTFYRVSERAAAWIAAGWSEAMVTAETRIVTERAGTTMPLAYYEKVFATAAARAAQPVPTATIKPAENVDVRPNSRPGNRGSLAEAGARLLERQRRLEQDDGLASDWSSDQSGRLLSSR